MADLAHVLRHLPRFDDERILAGTNPADDAGVFRLRSDLAIVQTVDFFTPIVDDPHTFGRIAATNSLSDIYAMGAEPVTALNIVGFPVKKLGTEILSEILAGGAQVCLDAGISIIGGHTVEDSEPKFGLAVTGIVHPDELITAHGAKPGDLLILTKPLGTGLISTAAKAGEAAPQHLAQAISWMSMLNRGAAHAMRACGAHAATDITGFGLLGHLSDLAAASGVAAEIRADAVPILPGAVDYARRGHAAGGLWSNLAHLEDRVEFAADLEDELRLVLVDPQTSGGLLIAVPPSSADEYPRRVRDQGLSAVVGQIVAGSPGTVFVAA